MVQRATCALTQSDSGGQNPNGDGMRRARSCGQVRMSSFVFAIRKLYPLSSSDPHPCARFWACPRRAHPPARQRVPLHCKAIATSELLRELKPRSSVATDFQVAFNQDHHALYIGFSAAVGHKSNTCFNVLRVNSTCEGMCAPKDQVQTIADFEQI
jgi:hypothetical protein